MPASQPANFNLQEFTDAGQLLVGGRLYTYGYGTTAQKTAFTDPAGTVPHTYTNDGAGGQFIALNARGELPAPLYLGAGSYDIALKRADGSTVWTRKADGVENSLKTWVEALAGSLGAGLLGFLQAFAGAVKRTVQDKLQDEVTALDFMTTAQIEDVRSGTGEVEVTTAVQKAINTGKRVFFPNGAYRIGPLKVRSGTELVGESKSGVILIPTGAADIFAWTYAADGVLFRFLFENFTVDASDLTGRFVNFDGMQYGAIKDIYFRKGSNVLVRVTFSYFNVLENLHFANSAYGVWLYGSSYDNGPNHNVLRNINGENMTQWLVRMEYCRGNIIDTIDAEYSNDNLKSAVILENCSYCHIDQFWYEALYATTAEPAIRITGNSLSNNKKNRLNWSPQIIHPSVALAITSSQDTVVDNYRFVDGTTNISEFGNSGLVIVEPQFEGFSENEISYGSNDTKVITRGGATIKQLVNAEFSLQSVADGYNRIRISAGGVDKFRITTKPETAEVTISTVQGELLTFSNTGEIIPHKGIQFIYSKSAAAAAPNTLFVDSADDKLKYKNGASVINLLY